MEKLELMASIEALHIVVDAVESCLEEHECPYDIKMQIVVSVDEIYSNIANYAYHGEPGPATVQMEVLEDPRRFRITFIDQGIPYNPLAKEDPDVTLSAEERNIGGLGIFMVKQFMDHLEYCYENNSNMFTLEKNFA